MEDQPKYGEPMREIKFRVFAYTDNGMQMVYLNEIECDNGLWFQSKEHIDDYADHIMQYTGMKDAEEKEIFEGDILLVRTGIHGRYLPVTVDDYHGYRFMLGKDQLTKDDSLKSKVIGNIYENPELLNQ